MSDKVELPPQDIILLAKTSIGMFLFITLIELIKSLVFPGIALLASYILTIFIVTFSFVIFFNNFLHRVIKDRRTVQKENDKYEENFLALIDNIPVATFRTIANSNGRILNVNSVGLKMFDLFGIDLSTITINDLTNNHKRVDEIIEKIMKYGIIENAEIEFKTPKGRVFWGQISAIVKKDEDDKTYFEGYINDTSNVKNLQEKLNTTTHELEKINLLIASGELKISDLKKEINSPHTHV